MDFELVLAALDALVLERVQGERFVRRGALPAWCALVGRESALDLDAQVALDDVFPVLGAFLPEAEEAWGAGAPRTSAFWTEGPRGEEVHLEAVAVCVSGAAVLVVRRAERLFREQQLVLTRARELAITHRALVREIERKDVLVHAIVHDLGAPLHSILGTLSLLEERSLGPREAGWVELALKAATRQREMIREILDVFSAERIEDGGQGDLGSAIGQVIDELTPAAHRKGVVIEGVIGEGAEVVGEPRRLVRVLANLIENALRHSPRGGRIRVDAQRLGDAMRVSVEDEGPGVPHAQRAALFEKLGRASAGGAGLGLYFCRITVERWGGQIGYEPRGGGGSRFWVRLPLAARSEEG